MARTNNVIRFIGAQNGIYEFQLNVQGRKFAPGIHFR